MYRYYPSQRLSQPESRMGRAETLMTRHVREATFNGQATLLGHLPATQVMQLDVVLPLRDQAGLDAFLADLRNPYSPDYKHFLTPTEFTERFGPTQQDYDAVVQYVAGAQAWRLSADRGTAWKCRSKGRCRPSSRPSM